MGMTPVPSTNDVELGARFGWLAKGGVFSIIGLLGLDIARRGFSSDDADQTGALTVIAEAPAGRVLVAVVGVGLFLFAVWQMWSAAVGESDNVLDIVRRIGTAGLGVSYALLAASGLQIAVNGPSDVSGSGEGGATSPETIAAFLLDAWGGRIAVALIGVGTIGVGLYHLWKGVTMRFVDDIDDESLDDPVRTPLLGLGVFGFVARSLMLGVAGWLFISAAWNYDPEEAAGLDESLRALAAAPMGRIVLAIASVGLIAAGIYDAATFRRQELDG